MSGDSYVYVASSWRNERQGLVCAALWGAGIGHYDFKNPAGGTGFSWKEVKTSEASAKRCAGFESDLAAMQRATHIVMVLPCGKSAHLELGWGAGAGKRTAVLLEDPVEPELMYRCADLLSTSLDEILQWAAS